MNFSSINAEASNVDVEVYRDACNTYDALASEEASTALFQPGSLELFILDTSAWSRKCDQHNGLSRIQSQCAAMKLLCADAAPEKVGIISMGGYASRVEVRLAPSTGWHVLKEKNQMSGLEQAKNDCDTFKTFDSVPVPDSSASSVKYPDPNRLLSALSKCVDCVSKTKREATIQNASRCWSSRVRVTVFLCSPPLGMDLIRTKLEKVLLQLKSLQVEVELLMHPNSYDVTYMKRAVSIWRRYDPRTDYSPNLRCKAVDCAILKELFQAPCLGYSINQEDFVATLNLDAEYYLFWDRNSVYNRWKECFGRDPFPLNFKTENVGLLTDITNELQSNCMVSDSAFCKSRSCAIL